MKLWWKFLVALLLTLPSCRPAPGPAQPIVEPDLSTDSVDTGAPPATGAWTWESLLDKDPDLVHAKLGGPDCKRGGVTPPPTPQNRAWSFSFWTSACQYEPAEAGAVPGFTVKTIRWDRNKPAAIMLEPSDPIRMEDAVKRLNLNEPLEKYAVGRDTLQAVIRWHNGDTSDPRVVEILGGEDLSETVKEVRIYDHIGTTWSAGLPVAQLIQDTKLSFVGHGRQPYEPVVVVFGPTSTTYGLAYRPTLGPNRASVVAQGDMHLDHLGTALKTLAQAPDRESSPVDSRRITVVPDRTAKVSRLDKLVEHGRQHGVRSMDLVGARGGSDAFSLLGSWSLVTNAEARQRSEERDVELNWPPGHKQKMRTVFHHVGRDFVHLHLGLNGIDVFAGGKRLKPRGTCAKNGPTLCLHTTPTNLFERYPWADLYNVLVELKKERKVEELDLSADGDLPISHVMQTGTLAKHYVRDANGECAQQLEPAQAKQPRPCQTSSLRTKDAPYPVDGKPMFLDVFWAGTNPPETSR